MLFDKGDAGFGCYRIPAIVKTKAGTLLAFAEARRAWCADSQEIDLVMRRSEDDGRTWSATQTVLSGTDTDPNAVATRGNPAPIVDYETGRIVLLSTMDPGTTSRPRTPYVQFSDDDGKTWSKAKNIGDQIDDPAWGWYATGPVHGIQLTRGAHAGRLVAGHQLRQRRRQERGPARLQRRPRRDLAQGRDRPPLGRHPAGDQRRREGRRRHVRRCAQQRRYVGSEPDGRGQ